MGAYTYPNADVQRYECSHEFILKCISPRECFFFLESIMHLCS